MFKFDFDYIFKHRLLWLLNIKLNLIIFYFLFGTSNLKGQYTLLKNKKVCFIGNSITHGGEYHSFFYMFYATRLPMEQVKFYNCGIAGDIAGGVLKRLDDDIMIHDPTVCTLMIGMNDVCRHLYSTKLHDNNLDKEKADVISEYARNVEKIIVYFKNKGIKLILFTPTPYDQSVQLETENLFGVNDALGKCRKILLEMASKYELPVVDFYKYMNKINKRIQKSDPTFTIIGNDRVHPQLFGHLIMAYLFLSHKSNNPFVWSCKLDIKNLCKTSQTNCHVNYLKTQDSCILFSLNENALPFPIDERDQRAIQIVPFQEKLNRQQLAVKNLRNGFYDLFINESRIGTFSAKEFSKGINLALFRNTPQNKISSKIRELSDERNAIWDKLRTFSMIEFNNLSNISKNDSLQVNQYLTNSLKTYSEQDWMYSCIKTYLNEKPNEFRLINRIQAIEDTIYTINNPRTYRYMIVKR